MSAEAQIVAEVAYEECLSKAEAEIEKANEELAEA